MLTIFEEVLDYGQIKKAEGQMITFNLIRFSAIFRWTLGLSVLIIPQLVQAQWQAIVGAESPDRGSQGLAFLPNELWVHTGDSILWTFPTHERHTLTFLKPGQTRPPGFGPIFGVPVGCPGLTPDGSSFDGTACVTTGVLLLGEDTGPTESAPTYTVNFPAVGNFKFVCLIHADMTGVVHVLDESETLPHYQDFYDRQAQSEQVLLLADASRLEGRGTPGDQDRAQGSEVAAGIGEIVTTTGGGSQTASLMRSVNLRQSSSRFRQYRPPPRCPALDPGPQEFPGPPGEKRPQAVALARSAPDDHRNPGNGEAFQIRREHGPLRSCPRESGKQT